jgi:3-deoxy-D-manno-octulosonate 8-phosphate phosphatase (KDO 8-P phosphatase)
MKYETIIDQKVWERARAVKGVVLDVDGVLTDGSIFLDQNGVETKSFNVKDGIGLRLLMRHGLPIAFISGRTSPSVTLRAKELGINEVHQGIKDKVAVFCSILHRWNIQEHEAAFIGDDLPDLPVLGRAGLSVTVADASPDVKQRVHLVTQARGGQGAVREVCEVILKTRMDWPPSEAT